MIGLDGVHGTGLTRAGRKFSAQLRTSAHQGTRASIWRTLSLP